jgi:hypothetical protein
MGADLLPAERILWQGRPVHRAVFLRHDLRWMRFSLKFHAVVFAITAVIAVLVDTWLDLDEIWMIALATVIVPEIFTLSEPFVWRYRTLRRTTYYITDQRVVSVPRRRARSVRLAEIDNLSYVEEADGSGYIRLDQRIMPDGFGNGTVAELIHVPDVREVVDLLAGLTGRTPVAH